MRKIAIKQPQIQLTDMHKLYSGELESRIRENLEMIGFKNECSLITYFENGSTCAADRS